LNLQLTILET